MEGVGGEEPGVAVRVKVEREREVWAVVQLERWELEGGGGGRRGEKRERKCLVKSKLWKQSGGSKR